jgi:hypothetical protein
MTIQTLAWIDGMKKAKYKRKTHKSAPGDDELSSSEGRSPKKRRFEDGNSAREEASPYRLATARMPVRAMTSTWSLGKNRQVDTQHVRRLCNIFLQGGLHRTAEENHLMVLCSREELANMQSFAKRSRDEHAVVEAAGEAAGGAAGGAAGETPIFSDWLVANPGRPVEIMAGQHRARALEAYVQQTGVREEELWWTCEFYDQGRSNPDGGAAYCTLADASGNADQNACP